jgi:hypothetical protein
LRAKKLKNVEKIFLFWFRRSEAEAGGNAHHYSGFCSKKVRTSIKKHRTPKTPERVFLIWRAERKGFEGREKNRAGEVLVRSAPVPESERGRIPSSPPKKSLISFEMRDFNKEKFFKKQS